MLRTFAGATLLALLTAGPAAAQDRASAPAGASGPMLAALTGAASVQGIATNGSSHDVLALDIAGMRLGMSPEEIRAALVRAGYTPRAEDPTQNSWEAQVSREVARRRNIAPDNSKVPMFTMARGPRGEHLEIWYTATSEGARASHIKYSIPTDQVTREGFVAAARAKYGAATASAPLRSYDYCSPGETNCGDIAGQRMPHLKVRLEYSNNYIELQMGANFSAERRRIFDAAVEQRAPRDAVPNF